MNTQLNTLPGNQQQTVAEQIHLQGRGLHTGRHATLRILPAEVNTGIRFRRIDAKGDGTEIPAHWSRTKELPLCTCIVSDSGVQVRTIEHLMAALYACQIDNALIEIRGEELPIFDGSSRAFVAALDAAGSVPQEATKKVIRILKPIEIREDGRWIKIKPADSFSIDLTISLAKFGPFNWSGPVDPVTFKQEITCARTFGRLHNGIIAKIATRFWRDPVCLGANRQSALVLVGSKVLNKGGLRMPDEFIRHRVLDTVADMTLAGAHIKGKITGYSTAHRLNHKLLRTLFSDESAWCFDLNIS
ncbi:MAG: UDP-3-O-[3-hydroxymyristoyl] N-acetylglucosamine deacetylase [Gammaproteobacteria bacterium]|nr:UDP-3-O-[3-hydroxymyristoyl] N-acetylglucosamine deacetylase [Gammaproteobacteria bacterium]